MFPRVDAPCPLAIGDGVNRGLFRQIGVEVADHRNARVRRSQRERHESLFRIVHVPGRGGEVVERQIGLAVAVEVALERNDVGGTEGCTAREPERGRSWSCRSLRRILNEPASLIGGGIGAPECRVGIAVAIVVGGDGNDGHGHRIAGSEALPLMASITMTCSVIWPSVKTLGNWIEKL